jgi:hypothetical protein
LDFEKLVDVLEGGYGGQATARRAGLVLEMLRNSSIYYKHLPEEVLKRIEGLTGGGRKYLIAGRGGRLVKRWGLIVPDDFRGLLRAV